MYPLIRYKIVVENTYSHEVLNTVVRGLKYDVAVKVAEEAGNRLTFVNQRAAIRPDYSLLWAVGILCVGFICIIKLL